VLTASDLIANLFFWRDPPFLAFFVYFFVTLLGGVTVLLVLRPVSCIRKFADMPELATFTVLIVAGSAAGMDIWRYLERFS
jgi:hypothetical protein